MNITNENVITTPRTPYNITETSYAQLHNEIIEGCKFIEKFINKKSEKYKDSEIFQTLIALHKLFKGEIGRGMALRKALVRLKGENEKLRNDIQSLTNLISTKDHCVLKSITDIQHYFETKFDQRENQQANTIQELKEKCQNSENTNIQLNIQISVLKEQIRNLENIENNSVPKENFENLRNELNSMKISSESKDKEIINLRSQITLTNDQKDKCKQLEASLLEEKNKNEDLLDQISKITQHITQLEDGSARVSEKLQNDIAQYQQRIEVLTQDMELQSSKYEKKIEKLERDNTVLTSALKRVPRNNDIPVQKQNSRLELAFKDICNTLEVSHYTDPLEVAKLVAGRFGPSFSSTTFLESTRIPEISFRAIMLIGITCTRLCSIIQV